MKDRIEIRHYEYECGDGCCYESGTTVTVNGELVADVAHGSERLEALAFDAARVEWKYGRNDDGTPKNWTEWNNLRESLFEHVRQPQELEPDEARH